MEGTIVLPSLNRPHLLVEFFKSYRDTRSFVPGLLLIDEDDYQKNKEAYCSLQLPENWEIVVTGKSVTMGDKIRFVWNRIVNLDWVTILNDDHRPRSEEWDKKILSQINGHNVVATNDGWKAPQRLCGAITYSGKVLRTVGWMFPPGVHHLYHDDIWELLCSRAECAHILMDVLVEHDHAFRNKKEDDTHKKVYADEAWKRDTEGFQTWLRTNAEQDIQNLIDIQPKMGVMIATPTQSGDVSFEYAVGLGNACTLMSRNNIYFQIAHVKNSSLLPHARNTLVDMFLKSRCQKLLFIDADQGWNAPDLMALLQSNKRIIAGITPHKRFPINMNFEPLPEHHKYFRDLVHKGGAELIEYAKALCDQKGEIEVNRCGTGFIMIDRSVFEILKPRCETYKPFDDAARQHVTHTEFFKMGPGKNGRYNGEDWHFTEMCKEEGIPLFINVNVRLIHKGSVDFQIDIPQMVPQPVNPQEEANKESKLEVVK